MEHNQTEELKLECEHLQDQLHNAHEIHAKQEELILSLKEVGFVSDALVKWIVVDLLYS